jgi:fructose-1,6-bisphosphatase II
MIEADRGHSPRPDYYRVPIIRTEDGTRQLGELMPVYKEIERLHKDIQIVTGRTAIAVHDIMQTYDPYPMDSSNEELKPQKDRNDNLAARVMISELGFIPRSINMRTGEGAKDILNGHEIDLVQGNYGSGGAEHDGVNDPLEGTTLSVKKLEGVTSVIAITEPNGVIDIPEESDYMQKIFAPLVGGQSIDDEAHIAVGKVANGLGIDLSQLRVTVLDRPRNQMIIDDLRELERLGLDLNLIDAGDLLPSVVAGNKIDNSGKYNMVLGIGGGPEGLIAAVAAKATGATFAEARWWPKDPEVRSKHTRVLTLNDLVPGRASEIVVELAHVTPDSTYTDQKGVRNYQNGSIQTFVDFTSVDFNGIRYHTKSF